MHLLKEGVNIKQLQRMFLKLPENWPPKRLDKKGCYETYVECQGTQEECDAEL